MHADPRPGEDDVDRDDAAALSRATSGGDSDAADATGTTGTGPGGTFVGRVSGQWKDPLPPTTRTLAAGPCRGRAPQSARRRPIFEPSQVSGSNFRSTTRSLSGMMPLSVRWIPSGQTSLQHLVMLQ